ncbi:MAG: hypothetical protein PF518_00070 [Spirochaetaceae bacterium]|jgi:hypothetical protein|nr:hypothetical protein [Spirochaetaceae bacterium]
MEKYSEELLQKIQELKILADKNRQEKSLNKLSKSFISWKKKTIDSDSMAAQVREWYFINGETNGYTQGSDPGLPIAKALTDGYLKEKDIPAELLSKLEMLIEIMKV